jgi:hypothetical protein
VRPANISLPEPGPAYQEHSDSTRGESRSTRPSAAIRPGNLIAPFRAPSTAIEPGRSGDAAISPPPWAGSIGRSADRLDRAALAGDHRERGFILFDSGRFPEAIGACDASLALFADDPEVHLPAHRGMLELGCYAAARPLLRLVSGQFKPRPSS